MLGRRFLLGKVVLNLEGELYNRYSRPCANMCWRLDVCVPLLVNRAVISRSQSTSMQLNTDLDSGPKIPHCLNG